MTQTINEPKCAECGTDHTDVMLKCSGYRPVPDDVAETVVDPHHQWNEDRRCRQCGVSMYSTRGPVACSGRPETVEAVKLSFVDQVLTKDNVAAQALFRQARDLGIDRPWERGTPHEKTVLAQNSLCDLVENGLRIGWETADAALTDRVRVLEEAGTKAMEACRVIEAIEAMPDTDLGIRRVEMYVRDLKALAAELTELRQRVEQCGAKISELLQVGNNLATIVLAMVKIHKAEYGPDHSCVWCREAQAALGGE